MFSISSLDHEKDGIAIEWVKYRLIPFIKRLPLIKQWIDLQLNVKRLNYSMNTFHCIDNAYSQRMDEITIRLERHSKVIATMLDEDGQWQQNLSQRLDNQRARISEVEASCEAFIDELDYIEGRSHLIIR